MSIKSVFDKFCGSLKIDSRFANSVLAFEKNFVNKNEDHIRFFGNGLLSTEVKWLPSDTARYFSEILNADEEELQKALYAENSVNPEHKVASNAFNLSITYLVHRSLTSSMPQKQKEDVAVKLLSILQYKFLSSILNHFFRWGVNPQIAQRTYESMNFKYDLRVHRNWYNLCEAKSIMMVSRQGLHYQTFIRYGDDDDVQYILSDTQTRARSTIKNITELYYQVRSEGAGISVTSSLMEMEGELGVRDLKRNSSQYRRYLEGIIGDSASFVRQNLVDIVAEANPSGNLGYFQATLNYLSSIYNSPKEKKIQEFVKRTLDFSFQLITDKGINQNNLSEVMLVIKGAVNSSRNTSREVIYLRTEGDKLARRAIGKKSPYPVSGERTAVILYMVLRAMTMNYYTNLPTAAS